MIAWVAMSRFKERKKKKRKWNLLNGSDVINKIQQKDRFRLRRELRFENFHPFLLNLFSS